MSGQATWPGPRARCPDPDGPRQGRGAPGGPSPVDVLIPATVAGAGAERSGRHRWRRRGRRPRGAADGTGPHWWPVPTSPRCRWTPSPRTPGSRGGLRRGGAGRAGALGARGRAAAAGRRPAARAQDRYELIMGERRWRAAREAGLHRHPGDRARHRRRRHAARRAAGEPAPQPAEPAGGGGGLRPAARGLRLHPRRAGRPDRPVPAADLQHPAAAQAAAARCSAGSPPGCSRPGTPAPCSGWTTPAAQERLAQRIVAEGLSVRSRRGDRRARRRDQPAARPAPAAAGRWHRSWRSWPTGSPTGSRPGSRSTSAGPRAGSSWSSPRSTTSSGSSP